jgi:hypothetical protein
MAHNCSRLWALSDSQLLAHFDYLYPQPNSWRFCSLKPEMLSAIASALSKMRSDPASLLHTHVRAIDIGNIGSPFTTSTISTHSYLTCQTQSQSSKFLRHTTSAETLHPVVDPSEMVQWTTPYVRWARASPAWVPKTYETQLPATWTFVSSTKLGGEKTGRPPNTSQTHSYPSPDGHHFFSAF